MNALRERARCIWEFTLAHPHLAEAELDFIERHLREAYNDGVFSMKEEMEARIDKLPIPEGTPNPLMKVYLAAPAIAKAEACKEAVKNFRDSSVGVHPYPDPAPRPTAENALKAVSDLTDLLLRAGAWEDVGLKEEALTLRNGCNDLLNGWGDTAEARAITGESPKNSPTTTEGK